MCLRPQLWWFNKKWLWLLNCHFGHLTTFHTFVGPKISVKAPFVNFMSICENNIVGHNCPELRDLVNYVLPLIADQWYYLRLQLLDTKHVMELNTIKADTRNDNKLGGRKMFNKWLKTDVQASWDKLIKALKLNNVASDIKQLVRQGNMSQKCKCVICDCSTDSCIGINK